MGTSSTFSGRKILISVCGGIAAYKICGLVSSLTQMGAQVRVAMTQMATRFVGPLSFEALCRHPVLLDVEGEGSQAMEHIEAARWADIMLIAPCTANMLGKLSAGLADDVISTMSMAFDGPQLLAPAMNPVMWSKPSLKRNLEILRGDGYILIEPAEGFMACGDTGVGRLPEEEVLVAALLKSLG